MEGFFSVIFGIIWIVVIISIISRAAGRANQNRYRGTSQPSARDREAQLLAMQQQRREQMTGSASQSSQSKPTFRSVPGSTYGTTRSVPQNQTTAQRNSGYGHGAFAPASTAGKIRTSTRKDTAAGSVFGSRRAGTLDESSVLLEDRRNDWLARQLREEAAIKRRGSVYDLGANHDADCDAERLRLFHIRRHNTNGLDKQTFR